MTEGVKMLALTFAGTEQIVLDEVPKPQLLEPTDIIVRVTLCGICGRWGGCGGVCFKLWLWRRVFQAVAPAVWPWHYC